MKFNSEILIIYIAAINALAFALFAQDKRLAQNRRWRIRERSLLLVALLGGATGGLIGMHVFRHKTRHLLFRWGLPLMVIAQGLCLFHLLW
ncbi:MAG: DUF1294 domain-containing protein [Syntrophomonadaceae bacterium]|nr:DUF1294 domain-containing protein [Syntrophomonadaceae bacterium]